MKGQIEIRLPADPDRPPSFLSLSVLFHSLVGSPISSACLLCLPPRSTVGFRSCRSQRRCKKEGGGEEDPEGRRDRKADPLGLSGRGQRGFAQPQGWRRLSLGFLCAGASESRVTRSARSLSLLLWKPRLPTKHLGATFLRGREGGLCGC